MIVSLALAFTQGVAAAGSPPAAPPPDLVALVRSAEAAGRTGRPEEARRAWLAAADRTPEIADWFRLRAAELTRDSASRVVLYTRLTLAPARVRITATEATAREISGNLRGALVLREAMGQTGEALRLRLRLATTPVERAEVRRALLELVERRPATAETEQAGTLLSTAFSPVTAREALILARLAVERRQSARAVALFARGLGAAGATAEDSLAQVRSLLRLGRPAEAIAAAARITGTPATRAAAELERARAQLRQSDPAAARTTLARLVARYPGDTPAVVEALLLQGDLAWDDDRIEEARQAFLNAGNGAPEHPLAPRAAFLAGLATWMLGRPEEAAQTWEQLRRDYPASEPAPAAGYWAGRAWERAGHLARARALWAALRTQDTLSYYAVVSAERLGVAPWTPGPAVDRFEHFPDVDSGVARSRLLDALGLATESGYERDWLVARAGESIERRLATAHALHQAGQPTLGVRLARGALAAGAPADARTYRLIYPFPLRDAIHTLAEEAGVDPLLVAALTRQESMWEARARSSAGARGLMQVMPATGDHVARRLKLSGFTTEQLYEPETNLKVGTVYLAETLRRCSGDVVCALAAYNAGPGRIARWMARPGGDDRDLLIERMAFAETRDYVRIVHRNLSLYRALYADGASAQ